MRMQFMSLAIRWQNAVAVCAAALAISVIALAAVAQTSDDGRRAVNVKRYGIAVRVPQAWGLINWQRDDQAFALKLPQDGGKSGRVVCSLGVAPENLED